MKREAAELISDYGGEIRENYSGRGMYGKETAGVIFDDEKEFYKTVAEIVQMCIEDNNAEDCDLICDALRNMQIDNMGKGIIYY